MGRRQRFVLCLFGALILTCVLIVVVGNTLGAYSGTALVDAGKEGLKGAISGLIGALSMLIGDGHERR